MPSTSQRQTILDYLAETLFLTIDAGATYNHTVAKSARGLLSPEQLGVSDFPALFVANADEDRENVSNKDFMSIMHVFVVGYVKKNQTDLDIQQELDKLIYDVTVALYTDPTQGSRASWTEIKTINTDYGDDLEQASFVMQVDFRYKNPGTTP